MPQGSLRTHLRDVEPNRRPTLHADIPEDPRSQVRAGRGVLRASSPPSHGGTCSIARSTCEKCERSDAAAGIIVLHPGHVRDTTRPEQHGGPVSPGHDGAANVAT